MAFGDFTVARNSTKWVVGSNGSLTSYAAHEPAFEFNADGTYKGLLVEPASKNEIRNNTGNGAAVGTPGTLPTNWAEVLNGLTREVVATGTENGVEYIDLKFSGTATSTGANIRFESATQIVAADGETWTHSFWAKAVDETIAPDGYRSNIYERDSGGTFVASDAEVFTPTATLTRFEHTHTLAGGGTVARVQSLIVFILTNGNTYDFTIRIGLPQLEKQPLATSVIKTSTASVSRVKDDITLGSASSLIGQGEGTLYVEIDFRNATGVEQTLLAVSDGTNTNRITFYCSTSDNFTALFNANGVPVGFGAEPATAGEHKIAYAYKEDDAIFALDGTTYDADSDVDLSALATLTDVDLGQRSTADLQANCHIKAIALFTRRLTNSELTSLTS